MAKFGIYIGKNRVASNGRQASKARGGGGSGGFGNHLGLPGLGVQGLGPSGFRGSGFRV